MVLFASRLSAVSAAAFATFSAIFLVFFNCLTSYDHSLSSLKFFTILLAEVRKNHVKMQKFTVRRISKCFSVYFNCVVDIVCSSLFILLNTDDNIHPSGDVN